MVVERAIHERGGGGMNVEVTLTVNGTPVVVTVDVRSTLADMVRDCLGLTATHLGCEQGVCGSCTVLVDGRSARSCLMLAASADGCHVTTVEGLAGDGDLHPVQEAFLHVTMRSSVGSAPRGSSPPWSR